MMNEPATPPVPGLAVGDAASPVEQPVATDPAAPTGPAVSPAGWGAPAGFGAAPSAEAVTAAAAAGPAQRRQAFVLFGVAIALVVVGLVTVFASLSFVWTGAFLFALVLLVRSVGAYRASARAGASSVAKDRPLLAVAAVVLVACLVAGAFAIAKYSSDSKDAHASTGVGSCWRDADASHLQAVDCSHDHQYVGTKIVSDEQDCGDAVGAVETEDSKVLCLDPA